MLYIELPNAHCCCSAYGLLLLLCSCAVSGCGTDCVPQAEPATCMLHQTAASVQQQLHPSLARLLKADLTRAKSSCSSLTRSVILL